MNVQMPDSTEAFEAFDHFANWIVLLSLFVVTWFIQILIVSESLTEPQQQELADLIVIGPNLSFSPWTILLYIAITWMMVPVLLIGFRMLAAKVTGESA